MAALIPATLKSRDIAPRLTGDNKTRPGDKVVETAKSKVKYIIMYGPIEFAKHTSSI